MLSNSTFRQYMPLKHAGECSSPIYDIEVIANLSLDECLRRCDVLHMQHVNAKRYVLQRRMCESIGYHEETAMCSLKSHCNDRRGMLDGFCPARAGWCYFTRGPLTKISETALAKAQVMRLRANALRKFDEEKERLWSQQRLIGDENACLVAPPATVRPGKPINSTTMKNWRYYSILECGSATHPSSKLCLTFKSTGKAAYLGGLTSTDGQHFHSRSEVLRLPGAWQENLFTHNVALLRLEGDNYAMLGGKQGFVSRNDCRWLRCRPVGGNGTFDRARGRCRIFKRKRGSGWVATGGPLVRKDCVKQGLRTSDDQPLELECLRNITRQDCLVPDQRSQRGRASSYLPATGIRLSRGQQLPWNSRRWTLPKPIISGTSPSGCIDRRPQYTGYPRIKACEFDGRLSVLRHRGSFRLYARANLKFGAVAGGRFVQTTSSPRLEKGWEPWAQVSIAGVDPNKMDIYFFAVQNNPVDPQNLVAIFPLTHPPHACIMLAFSEDGVSFSHPIRLQMATLGARTEGRRGTGRLEWRSEDHPAAGIVRAPNEPSRLLFYIHHAVRGTTMRGDAIAHVRLYSITVEEMRRSMQLSSSNKTLGR